MALKPFHRLNSKKSLFNNPDATLVKIGLGLLFADDMIDWLRSYVGERGRDWDMGTLDSTDINALRVAFRDSKHALLFTLKWLNKHKSF